MKYLVTFFLIIISHFSFCQNIENSKFNEEIKKLDFSDLWTLSKFDVKNGTKKMDRLEPLGFIGDNYQRFNIHFISAIKNPYDPFEYLIYGKTRVKDNICTFQGKIKITSGQTYTMQELPNKQLGYINGQYEFFEDSDQKGTGILKGNFQSDFYIEENGTIKYNALMIVADGFKNNQFEGTWTSYITKKSKKCNWGDYRIPDSGDLDNGAGEFGPNNKYHDVGWANYNKAWGYSLNKPETQEARKKEKEKWWIEKNE